MISPSVSSLLPETIHRVISWISDVTTTTELVPKITWKKQEHALLTTEKPTNGSVRLDLDLKNDGDCMITDTPSVRDLDQSS
ncbi:hypothetical protein Tco_0167444 [Tanacetum coccineum]